MDVFLPGDAVAQASHEHAVFSNPKASAVPFQLVARSVVPATIKHAGARGGRETPGRSPPRAASGQPSCGCQNQSAWHAACLLPCFDAERSGTIGVVRSRPSSSWPRSVTPRQRQCCPLKSHSPGHVPPQQRPLPKQPRG